MTDNNHPITPPPALVEQWYEAIDNSSTSWKQELATQAARWGADQELEACLEWVATATVYDITAYLRNARRPKPPSLKEQALEALEKWAEDEFGPGAVFHKGLEVGLIRRAIKALPD